MALDALGVDQLGAGRRGTAAICASIAGKLSGGPGRIETMSGSGWLTSPTRWKEVIEPFLLQQALIQRNPAGPDAGAEGTGRILAMAPPKRGRICLAECRGCLGGEFKTI